MWELLSKPMTHAVSLTDFYLVSEQFSLITKWQRALRFKFILALKVCPCFVISGFSKSDKYKLVN